MTARAFEIDEQLAENGRGRHLESAAGTLTRYRLDVIASNVDEVVRSAGGWLFDRSMAGWDVSLLTTEPSNPRALQILGIGTLPLDQTLESATVWPRSHSIAVAADVFNTDA